MRGKLRIAGLLIHAILSGHSLCAAVCITGRGFVLVQLIFLLSLL